MASGERRNAAKGAPRGNGPRAFRFVHNGEELLVLSIPLDAEPPPALTAAELEVARAIVRGASNQDIARERGTSVRTVANQVAALLRKLQVGSRAQVAATLARVDFDERHGEREAAG